MLTDLSFAQWCLLLVAVVLFLGPGYAVLSFFPSASHHGKTIAVALAFGLSLSVWAILLAWLQPLGLALNRVAAAAILGAGWIVALLRLRRHWPAVRASWQSMRRVDASRLALWMIVVLTVLSSIYALHHYAAGLGSDSYHHSLIVQLFVERGTIPTDYLPYAPLVTFTYHYGFHAFAAVLVWLTGLKAVVATALTAQILMALSALSVAFFAEALTGSRSAAALSAGLAGLASVFPAYYVNWGRDTQIAGLTILPIFLGLVWNWTDRRPTWREIVVVGLLAAGIGLTHYRIVLMAACGVLVLLGWRLITQRTARPELVGLLGSLAAAASVALVAAAPWLWHVWNTRHQGFAIVLGPATTGAFSMDRLSPGALGYPTNWALLALLLAALVLGWWWRDPVARPLSLWALALLVASVPGLLGANLDTVTVVISLYLPAAVISGWMIVRVVEHLEPRWKLLRPLAAGAAALLCLWGAISIARIGQAWAPYVFPRDIRAVEWIDAHTPLTARFMVNTFHFDFWPTFVLGSDAGWWLPVLAARQTVTAPLTYTLERASAPGYGDEMVALDQLNGHLTSPQALTILQKAGIDYVYIGERGGPIDVAELQASPVFQEEYHDGPVHVFHLMGRP